VIFQTRATIGQADIQEIFLSSTVQDLHAYRTHVQDALQRHSQIAVFLSGDWIEGYIDIIQLCRQRLQQASGYYGIFAYWYGSIPPNAQRSITCLEFEWARQRWQGDPAPRIAVFLPEPGSPADIDLSARTDQLLRQSFQSAAKRKQHKKLQHDFVREVSGSWRKINYFRNETELREQAIVVAERWRGTLLRLAGVAVRRDATDAELGALGRALNLEAVQEVLDRVGDSRSAQSVCLLLSSDEDAGQKQFLDFLVQQKMLRRGGRPAVRGRPPSDRFERSAALRWLAEACGIDTSVNSLGTPEALAESLQAALKERDLIVILEQVNRFAGGEIEFYAAVWRPLFAALQRLRVGLGGAARHLVLILGNYGPATGTAGFLRPWNEFDAARPDDRLLSLPGLAPISRRDLRRWLEEMDIPDEPVGRHDELAAIGLTNPVTGEVDGTPSRVFARLREEMLWPEDPQ
jgi:hypothetical protein